MEEKVQPLKRTRSTTLAHFVVPEATPLELPSSSPVLPIAPSLSPTLPKAEVATSSARSQERCPDLQRSSLDGLLGRRPEILLDYLRAPSPSREITAALPPPLCNSANLLTRSWNDKEKSFLAEMLIGKVVVTAQLHGHRSALYMMAMEDKVFFILALWFC